MSAVQPYLDELAAALEKVAQAHVVPTAVLQAPRQQGRPSWHATGPSVDVVPVYASGRQTTVSNYSQSFRPPASWSAKQKAWSDAWAGIQWAALLGKCACPDLEGGLLAGKMCRNGHWGYRRVSRAGVRRDALAELVAEAVELERVRAARRSHRRRRRR